MRLAGKQKPPCCGQAARGLGKKRDVNNPAISHGAAQAGLPAMPVCHDCRFIKPVRATEKIRKQCPVVCSLTGEAIKQDDPACGHFQQGGTGHDHRPETRFCLTEYARSCMVKVPNQSRRSQCLTRAPHGEKVGSFCFRCRKIFNEISPYRRERRSAWRERAAALIEPGSLRSRLFLCLKPLNQSGGVMPNTSTFNIATADPLLCNDMQLRTLDAVMQCSSNALQTMLDPEAAKGAPHE